MTVLSPTLAIMQKALELSAQSLVADFRQLGSLNIELKGPGDFVSQADKKAEELIVESLLKERPEWGFLGEEGANITGSDSRYRWIIDPLDGTNNFLHGMPHWCTTVALEKEGEIIAGVTYDPLLNETFHAEKGAGAYLNGERMKISVRDDLKNALTMIDCGYARRDDARFTKLGNVFALAEKHTSAVRMGGAGALDLCYVAAGRYDVMYHAGDAKPWDIAAGFLFVREAGGVITRLDMTATDHMHDQFLAGNPVMHGKFAELIDLKSA